MGLATVTQTEWGYLVTGDTDPTPVWEGRKYIQTMAFVPKAAADTVLIATTRNITGPLTNMWTTKSAGVAGVQQDLHFDGNVPADNPKVTFSDAGGQLFIYLRSR